MIIQQTRGKGNQVQHRKNEKKKHWQIQIIFTRRNQYHAQVFMYM